MFLHLPTLYLLFTSLIRHGSRLIMTMDARSVRTQQRCSFNPQRIGRRVLNRNPQSPPNSDYTEHFQRKWRLAFHCGRWNIRTPPPETRKHERACRRSRTRGTQLRLYCQFWSQHFTATAIFLKAVMWQGSEESRALATIKGVFTPRKFHGRGELHYLTRKGHHYTILSSTPCQIL